MPATEQWAALAFLAENVFGPEAFRFPKDLMDRLAAERFPDFTESIWSVRRLDYPIHGVVSAIQAWPLARLYDDLTMSRMLDVQVCADEGEDVLTLAEMFAGVREAVWSELSQGKDVNSFRRNLQRAHLDALISLVVAPGPATPADASTLARADLREIRRAIEEAMGSDGLDATTRAHLDETGARIDAALEAGLQRQMRL